MRRANLLTGVIAGVLVMSTLTGCAGTNEDSKPTETTTVAQAVEDTTEATTAAEETSAAEEISEETTAEADASDYIAITVEDSTSELNVQFDYDKDYAVDLDGDGTDEIVNIKTQSDYRVSVVINGKVEFKDLEYPVEKSRASIVDLDTNDSLKEICLYTIGVSDDFATEIITYRNTIASKNALALGNVQIDGKGHLLASVRTDSLLGTSYNLTVPYVFNDNELYMSGENATYIADTTLYADTKLYSDDLVNYIKDYVSQPSYDKNEVALLEENVDNEDYIVTTLPKDTKVKVSKVFLASENCGNGELEFKEFYSEHLYECMAMMAYIETEDGQSGWVDVHKTYKIEEIDNAFTNGVFYPLHLCD